MVTFVYEYTFDVPIGVQINPIERVDDNKFVTNIITGGFGDIDSYQYGEAEILFLGLKYLNPRHIKHLISMRITNNCDDRMSYFEFKPALPPRLISDA